MEKLNTPLHESMLYINTVKSTYKNSIVRNITFVGSVSNGNAHGLHALYL